MDVGAWPAVWLRDNCPCPECRVPGSGRKLFQITGLPEDLVVTAVEEDAATVTVTFGPDGHRSRFGRDWLAAHELAGLSADGRIRGIRFNHRSLQALRRPPGDVAAFYTAYRRWAQRLARP